MYFSNKRKSISDVDGSILKDQSKKKRKKKKNKTQLTICKLKFFNDICVFVLMCFICHLFFLSLPLPPSLPHLSFPPSANSLSTISFPNTPFGSKPFLTILNAATG